MPLNHPVISASSPLPVSPVMLQPSSLINTPVPFVHIRPGLQGLAPGLNYHLTQPFQRPLPLPPGGNPAHNHAFTSSVHSTERPFPVRTSNPIFLPRVTTSQTAHPVIPPFQGGSIAFTQPPPPPHVNISSVSFSCYTGVMTYSSPLFNATAMVSNGPYHHSELGLQPPDRVVTYTSVSGATPRTFSHRQASQTGAETLHSVSSCTAHSPISASAAPDVKSKSVANASVQQHKFINEQKPSNILDGPQNSEPDGNKRRRRRRRRRSRTNRGNREAEEREEGSDSSQTQGHTLSGSNVSESLLHFEDVDEFPDLVPSTSHGHSEDVAGHERSTLSGTSITYSDILKSVRSACLLCYQCSLFLLIVTHTF